MANSFTTTTASGAALTVAAILAQLRRYISDETPGQYRFPDTALIAYIDAAHRQLLSDRPDLRLAADDTFTAIGTLDATTDAVIPTGGQDKLAIAAWAGRMALLEDEPEGNAAKADVLLAVYAQRIG